MLFCINVENFLDLFIMLKKGIIIKGISKLFCFHCTLFNYLSLILDEQNNIIPIENYLPIENLYAPAKCINGSSFLNIKKDMSI